MTDTPRPNPDDRAAGKAADVANTPPDPGTQPTAALPDPNQSDVAQTAATQPDQAAAQPEAAAQPTVAAQPAAASPAEPVAARPGAPVAAAAPAKPKRTVSLLIAGLVGAGLLVAGGVGGYFIGEAGDDHRRGGPGFAREDRMGPGPGRGPRGDHAPWGDRGDRRGGTHTPGDFRPPGDPATPPTPPSAPTPAAPAPTTSS
ncbi:hypothetical protein [Actinokineospora xionganensis]|uniref:Translation initiation factor IF-2 n=1 Tax=Actinokineospora xionganensis TaxID=2684470 RepID=A0ABR7LBJ2_9PSEU|nr:hypothetical protein [Actinokineospora xionganensis]MBC6449937.1 hypothetical protein [Actinokineospora xionganensis]